ncbi:IclR family transcriptional regulator [Pontibacillus litoralis]|uniref:IclR family transcriptional regulator n=1 Tax=Pontibacillus litoralis JSM 072002 TaxID=1385512 RepID=A0A0A5HWB6_9BACI|nr:IclR family transcriptional regulator [Pontibacillus litoralis]KGX87922.1 IclR family transcriptional regulator [Pontibacillus litoralis JSM 072002]
MVQSIDRAMQIIHIISQDDHKNGWPISDIAKEADLPISTVHRLITALMKNGMIMRSPHTKRYSLGYIWMEIGLSLLEKMDVRDVSRPIMEKLAQDVEETVYFNLPNGGYSIIIERMDSPRSVKVIDSLGERIPLHIGAANKTILANIPTSEAQKVMEQFDLSANQIQQLLTDLQEIKQTGYALSFGEKTAGTASVGAPIFGFHNNIIAAISIELLNYELTNEQIAYYIEQVTAAGKQISQQLGARFAQNVYNIE